MRALRFVSYILLLLLVGCENRSELVSPANEHQRVDGLIPMKVGYYWVYLFSSYDTSGHIYPGTFDTVKIVRDTLINNELWFIFNDGYVRTNRTDGVWFLSRGEPRRGLPVVLNDSACTAPQPRPCDYYMKLVSIGERITIFGVSYDANVYDWIFPEFSNPLGYRYYIVAHLGNVREEVYSTTPSGYYFLAYSLDLLHSFVN